MGWLSGYAQRFKQIQKDGIAIENLFKWHCLHKKENPSEEMIRLQTQIISHLKREISLLESVIHNQDDLIKKQDEFAQKQTELVQAQKELVQAQKDVIKLTERGRKVVAIRRGNGNGGKRRA